jgi:hypothetical protein
MAPYVMQADVIASAPLPPAAKKTALRRLYESALAQDAKTALASPTGGSIVATVRGTGEAAAIGLALGWLAGGRAKGLDTPFGPIDGYAAGLAAVASVIPGNPVAEDCRNASIAATAILTYRKQEAKKRTETGKPVVAVNGPDDPADHIVALAKRLGITGP